MTNKQRLVLFICILASFVAFLDGSVVGVALPSITDELGGGLSTQQWIVDAYLITLGSLMLVAGSVSDLFGRKKVLIAGLIGFALASVLCAIAPSGIFLIIARGIQGIAGALLVPSSLALIISNFSDSAQGKAIGTWTAWTGIAFVVGPLLGGLLVDMFSWRLVFAINLFPIALTLWLMRSLPQPKQIQKNTSIDYVGAILCTIGVGGPVYALIEQAHYGWANPLIYIPFLLGIAALLLFVRYEKHISNPMIPLILFKTRNFNVGNIATIAIYAGLSIATFLITIFVQQVGGYSAIQAGMALLPVTIIMFILSPLFGALAGKYGPRLFMVIGPIIAGIGFLCMLTVNELVAYWLQLLPGIVLFGLGLSITVAPLTTAILGSINKYQAGIASAINNAISRVAGLVAIASVGVVTGTTVTLAGFHRAMILTAVLLLFGGIISAIGIRNVKS